MEIKSKKYIISLLITVFGLITLISSASYAILSGTTSSNNVHIVKAGSIELQLTEKYNNIEIGSHALTDVNGLLQQDVYEFTVTNIGSATAKYDLKLLNTAPSGYTALSSSYIRIGLEVNGREMGPMGLSNVSNVIDSNTINPDEIIRYKMRIWLDKSEESAIQNNSDKKAYLSVKLEAKQADYTPKTYVYTWNQNQITIGSASSSITGGTANYATLNKNSFVRHTIQDNIIVESHVCYILSTELYCLRGGVSNSYTDNTSILDESFGKENCSNGSDSDGNYYNCSNNIGAVRVYENGKVGTIFEGLCGVDSASNNGTAACFADF